MEPYYTTINLNSLQSYKDVRLYVRTKRLGNGIFVKSNIKLFVEFTNDNLSQKFVEHGTFSFQPCERA